MAERPVFQVIESGPELVQCPPVQFEWFPGMALTQARKSIQSLHAAAQRTVHIDRILEISTKSPDPLGVSLSAFNLTITTPRTQQGYSVESAFQASKVFEQGGPYVDLLRATSRDAKTDPRLSESGKLQSFRFYDQVWSLEPKTAFYDWLYLNALNRRPELSARVCDYSAFTDIAFNPQRSINCQARSAALFVALSVRNLLQSALAHRESFLNIVSLTPVTAVQSPALPFD